MFHARGRRTKGNSRHYFRSLVTLTSPFPCRARCEGPANADSAGLGQKCL